MTFQQRNHPSYAQIAGTGPRNAGPAVGGEVYLNYERIVIGYLLDPANRNTAGSAVRDIEPQHFLLPAHEHIYHSAKNNAGHGDVQMRVLESLIGPEAPRALNGLDRDLTVYLSDCVREAEGVDEYRIGHYTGRVREAYAQRLSQATMTRFADAFGRGDTAVANEALAELGNLLSGPSVRAEKSPARARIRKLTYRRSELDAIKSHGWLIDGILNRASLAVLAGKFGTYKSFASVSLAASVATGRPFLGREVCESGPVIYVAAEGGSGIRQRFEAWEQGHNHGQPISDDRLVVIAGAVNLLDPEQVAELDELCTEVGPRLLVLDTLHRCTPGSEENSAKEMGEVIEVISRLRESHDCTILADHHTGHGGQRSRGSSAIEDDADNSWVIRLSNDNEDRSASNQRTMEHRKVKEGETAAKIPIGLVKCGESAYLAEMAVASPVEVKGWLAVKSYAQQLDAAEVPFDYGKDRIRTALAAMGIKALDNNVLSDIAKLRKSPSYAPAGNRLGRVADDPGA